MASTFLSKVRIKASEIYEDAYEWLQKIYDQSKLVFTPASPFGQLLSVLSNITELIIYYIEAAISELNISKARSADSIYGLSQLTGHTAFRGSSARGMIAIRINNQNDNIEGDYVEIKNKTKFYIEDNGLPYYLNLDSDYIRLSKSERIFQNIEIIQGEIENQSFTSNGSSLMSFSVTTKSFTDDNLLRVFVNGEEWHKEESLYDMNAYSKCFIAKTNINGGINIFFGNGEFGMIPTKGAEITIEYVKCDGYIGNTNGKVFNITFEDFGVDYQGNEIDLNEVLSINIVHAPTFGSNAESREFTKLIAPHASKSFVLANPDNYIHYLSKYDTFSFIDAYNTKEDEYLDDDNVIYLTLIPNVNKKITDTKDYFNLTMDDFSLSDDEKDGVMQLLNRSGRQLMTSEVVINDNVIKKYVLNIAIKYFEHYDKETINSEIRSKLSKYFLNIQRRDSIPKSDIISIIENIDGVDSVNVFFVSEENEKAILDGFYYIPVYENDPYTGISKWIYNKKIILSDGEDPNLGLDKFGDIKLKRTEIGIIKGGFYDRNNNYYEEYPTTTGLGCINIFFLDKTDNNLYNKIQQNKLNKILNEKN
ncbi:MAG: hypothetical protein IKO36_08775 [Bacteroidaceae bacterium]|nr:hypothetical protein [Bacteroidaceae bacterium]